MKILVILLPKILPKERLVLSIKEADEEEKSSGSEVEAERRIIPTKLWSREVCSAMESA